MNTKKIVRNSVWSLLALGALAVAGNAVMEWDERKGQRQTEAEMEALAKEEHRLTRGCFAKPEMFGAILTYDPKSRKNFVELQPRLPLSFHAATVRLLVSARTQPVAEGDLAAASQTVTSEVALEGIEPGYAGKKRLCFPAQITLKPTGLAGAIGQLLSGGNGRTVEAPLAAASIQIEVAEQSFRCRHAGGAAIGGK